MNTYLIVTVLLSSLFVGEGKQGANIKWMENYSQGIMEKVEEEAKKLVSSVKLALEESRRAAVGDYDHALVELANMPKKCSGPATRAVASMRSNGFINFMRCQNLSIVITDVSDMISSTIAVTMNVTMNIEKFLANFTTCEGSLWEEISCAFTMMKNIQQVAIQQVRVIETYVQKMTSLGKNATETVKQCFSSQTNATLKGVMSNARNCKFSMHLLTPNRHLNKI